MKKADIYLSIGSNLGNPKENVDLAIEKIRSHKHLEVIKLSSYYLTSPVDYFDQPKFVNCALWLKSHYEAHKFHRLIKQIEVEIGKDKQFESGPRKIDIDILIFDDLTVINDDLRIPHYKMHLRKFVLIPLVEINKELIHPELNQTVEELLKNLPPNEMESVELLK